MKLTVLGSSGLPTDSQRNCSGYFLEVGEKTILLDCGPGTFQQMSRNNFNYNNIDIIVINHLHIDHIADLPLILFSLLYSQGPERKKDLYLIGGRGSKHFINSLINVFKLKPSEAGFKTHVVELDGEIEIGGLRIAGIPGNHDPSSMLARIIHYENILVYAGDTAYDENIARLAEFADLLILECSFPNKEYLKGRHLIPEIAGKIASESKCSKLLLTHLYPIARKFDLKKSTGKFFSGEIAVADDLLKISI